MIASKKIEFGDFQTPPELATKVSQFLRDSGEKPDVVVEPTCGTGGFVKAARDTFPHTEKYTVSISILNMWKC